MNEIRLDTAKLDQLAQSLNMRTERVVTSLAFDVEAIAKSLAIWDTGAMRSSIYVVTQDQDGYSAAAGDAKSLNPKAVTTPLPKPTGNTIANVGPCVDYAIWIEFGHHSWAGKPYLLPAAERVAQKLNSGETWQELFK